MSSPRGLRNLSEPKTPAPRKLKKTRSVSTSTSALCHRNRILYPHKNLNHSHKLDSFKTMPLCSEIVVFVSTPLPETSCDRASKALLLRYATLLFASHGLTKYHEKSSKMLQNSAPAPPSAPRQAQIASEPPQDAKKSLPDRAKVAQDRLETPQDAPRSPQARPPTPLEDAKEPKKPRKPRKI